MYQVRCSHLGSVSVSRVRFATSSQCRCLSAVFRDAWELVNQQMLSSNLYLTLRSYSHQRSFRLFPNAIHECQHVSKLFHRSCLAHTAYIPLVWAGLNSFWTTWWLEWSMRGLYTWSQILSAHTRFRRKSVPTKLSNQKLYMKMFWVQDDSTKVLRPFQTLLVTWLDVDLAWTAISRVSQPSHLEIQNFSSESSLGF